MEMEKEIKDICWNGFAASVPGAGHIRFGIPCQDASAIKKGEYPAIIVCDGRGSAKLSHYGAQEAVHAFKRQIAILAPFLANILDAADAKEESWERFCKLIYRTLMQAKLDLAEKYSCQENEFDFTVAFAIAGREHVGCFQVGDGAIVLWQNGETSTVFNPDKGEFANQTHFLRQGGEECGRFHHKLFKADTISGVSITSDGPEHLMFHLATMTPGKIFQQLFTDLSSHELCHQDLMDYLTRKEWQNDPRGADDRSIAIMVKDSSQEANMATEAISSHQEPLTDNNCVIEKEEDEYDDEPVSDDLLHIASPNRHICLLQSLSIVTLVAILTQFYFLYMENKSIRDLYNIITSQRNELNSHYSSATQSEESLDTLKDSISLKEGGKYGAEKFSTATINSSLETGAIPVSSTNNHPSKVFH